MLFHEIYSEYFNAVADIIDCAIEGKLTKRSLQQIVRKRAFGESAVTIPDMISGEWQLLDKKLHTPLHNSPTMPLTDMERMWMKALLSDPRISLFAEDIEPLEEGLEDVKPLYEADDFYYFDRFSKGDPYDDAQYVKNFRMILRALRKRRKIRISYRSRYGIPHETVCIPVCLEYSMKDDHFRVLVSGREPWGSQVINVSRISTCSLKEMLKEKGMDEKDRILLERQDRMTTVTFSLQDERNALERVSLHFSDLRKETVRLDQSSYRITLYYDKQDEREILIRLLSFGPAVKVEEPAEMVEMIRERLRKQSALE